MVKYLIADNSINPVLVNFTLDVNKDFPHIITVLKVVRVKVLLFLLVFAYFMIFLTRFEKTL